MFLASGDQMIFKGAPCLIFHEVQSVIGHYLDGPICAIAIKEPYLGFQSLIFYK
jgi:hypothetical protein